MASVVQWFRDFWNRLRSMISSSNHIVDKLPEKKKKIIVSDLSSTPSIGTLTSGQMTLFWLIWWWIAYLWYTVFQTLDILYLILTAWIISIAMESFIIAGQRWMPRWVSIGVSYIVLLVFLLMGIVIIVPFVLQQVSSMIALVIQNFYHIQSQINTLWLAGYIQSLSALPDFIKIYFLDALANGGADIQSAIVNNISSLVTAGTDYATKLASFGVGLLSDFVSFLWQIALVLTVAVFFSLEKDEVVRFLTHRVVSHEHIAYRSSKIDLLYIKMWLRLKSQLWLCVYIGIIVYVALWLLALIWFDLPNKWALALMAWFTEFIPYVWPLLWGIPALIVGTSMYGLPGMVAIGIVYYLIQWTENNVLIPMLMNKSLGVSPLLIFLCVLVWWSILWLLGVILAVPFAVILTLLVDKEFE